MDARINILIIPIIIFFSFQSFAQKNLIDEQDDVIKAAAAVFEASMQEDGVLFKLKEKHNITGVYIFDITVRDKGEVASVFAIDNEGGTIPSQNLVKDYVKAIKLGFKMPKNKRYKFRYKFNFNT